MGSSENTVKGKRKHNGFIQCSGAQTVTADLLNRFEVNDRLLTTAEVIIILCSPTTGPVDFKN